MRTYDREAFALAYVESLSRVVPAVDSEREGYAPALFAYREALADGLQQLYDVDLNEHSGVASPLLALFRRTAMSYLGTVTGPGDGFLEGSLLLDQLAEFGIAGDVLGDLERIQSINGDSRAIHLSVLTTLLGALLGDKADRTVTEDDLRAIGVEPTPPDPADYGF